MENDGLPPLKFCIRCEERIEPEDERFFSAVLRGGRRLVQYFCTTCFKIWNPSAAKRLNA